MESINLSLASLLSPSPEQPPPRIPSFGSMASLQTIHVSSAPDLLQREQELGAAGGAASGGNSGIEVGHAVRRLPQRRSEHLCGWGDGHMTDKDFLDKQRRLHRFWCLRRDGPGPSVQQVRWVISSLVLTETVCMHLQLTISWRIVLQLLAVSIFENSPWSRASITVGVLVLGMQVSPRPRNPHPHPHSVAPTPSISSPHAFTLGP